MPNPDREPTTPKNLSRREFLKLGIVAAAGALLGGCGPEQGSENQKETTATTEPISKEPPATATSQPTPPPTKWFSYQVAETT